MMKTPDNSSNCVDTLTDSSSGKIQTVDSIDGTRIAASSRVSLESTMSPPSSQQYQQNQQPRVVPTPPPKPSKLRRKVSVEESIENAVSVQRLVEYFFVVSCHSNDNGHNKTKSTTNRVPPNHGYPPTPDSIRPTVQRTPTSTPVVTSEEIKLDNVDGHSNLPPTPTKSSPLTSSTKNTSRIQGPDTNNNVNRKRERGQQIDDIDFKDEQETNEYRTNDQQCPNENREDSSLSHPSPKPRETWCRDENQGHEDNIHLPEVAEGDVYSFSPKITARFPYQDYPDNPLNPMLTHFCFASGDTVLPSKDYRMPSVHHFVLTNDKGRKVYGTCLTIYEEYNPPDNTPWDYNREILHSATVGVAGIEVSVVPEKTTLYIPRVLCILSIWPYVNAFREYLAQLYRLATSTDCMDAPIERYVINLCLEIPAPPPGAFEVQMSILDSVIRFWSPPAKLPIAYVSLPYHVLFDCLDVDNILHLWYCLSMERKVLLLSSQNSILTVCSEILCSLLYPMKWSHLYVPMLPRFLCPMLDAPVPYLCGVSRDNWTFVQQFISDETIVVDLDRNSVMFGQQTMELPPIPGKKWSKLQKSIQDIAGHLFWRARGVETEYRQFLADEINEFRFREMAKQKGDLIWREKLRTLDYAYNLYYTPDSEHLLNDGIDDQEQTQWDRLQEAFLRFFVAMFKDYRRFVHVPDSSKLGSPTVDSNHWIEWSKDHFFDQEGFIRSQKPEYFSYLSELCSTQQFDDFITKRLYSPELPDIIFFDQSIDAKLNRSRLKLKKLKTPFLQSAKAHKQLETFVAVKPNVSDLPQKGPFVYKTWPEKFNPKLLGHPRPIPIIITNEFDRQASLVKRLRMNYAPGVNEKANLIQFYGSDYDSSPEGMSFTVFFFSYSAVIGRELEGFHRKRRELEMEIINSPDIVSVANDAVPVPDDDPVEVVEVAEEESNLFSRFTLGLCDGDACLSGKTAFDNALIYVTSKNPCPNLNTQAQAMYQTLSDLAASIDPSQVVRNSSLLDNDAAFAEYEEAREVAVAQLDLAFDALKTMEDRGFTSDPDVFKSLMDACGRCGDTKGALHLIELMKRNKLVADNDVLVCFMASFAHYGVGEGKHGFQFEEKLMKGRRASDAYSHFLKKKLLATKGDDVLSRSLPTGLSMDDDEDSACEILSESGSERSSFTESGEAETPSFLQLLSGQRQSSDISKKKKRRQKSKKKSVVSDRMSKQLLLGESLLEFLYPDIYLDTCGDACPMCSNIMDEEDIVSGWQPCEFQDFTTSCPKCQHRFVPRFTVTTSSPNFEGSQGPGTPLYCEYLSPWVLRKELELVIGDGNNIEQILDPEWRSGRDVRATIWWNMIVMFKRYNLPFTFLLQGSFQNRLINPAPQD